MVAVISVDFYLCLGFSDLTCHLEDTELVFFGCTVLPDNKETKFGSSDQEASPSTGKNTGVVLVPCCAWTCPCSYFLCCRYFHDHWFSFVMIDDNSQ